MKYRLGIDLGGTSAKLAIVNQKRKIIREASFSTAGRPRPGNVIAAVGNRFRRMTSDLSVERVGVGVAGDIDFEHGVIRFSPNLGWKNVPFRKLLSKKIKKKVVVDNDANVAALGLYRTQAPRTVRHMIAVTLGTGVGGGVVLNGEVYRGATGSAGEIGHMVVERGGRRCNCGNRGCLETYAGGYYLARFARLRLKKGKDITPLTLDQAARKGDRFARSLWETAGRMLGQALGDLIYLLNPQMIYLTGGVAKANDLLLRPLRKELSMRTLTVPLRAVDIRIARESAHIGVLGASFL